MSYDPKCYELAEYFLPSGLPKSRLHYELAQCIQDAVEDWFYTVENRIAGQDPEGPPHVSSERGAV